jgi:hypothetical protein
VLAAALAQARQTLSDDQRLSHLQQQLVRGVSGFGDAAVVKT